MVSPQPGQVCIIIAEDLAYRDTMLAAGKAQDVETETAMNGQSFAER